MNTPSEPTPSARSRWRTLLNRQTVFAFLAGACLVGGIGAAAAATGWHHGMMMMHGTESPADMADHIDHVLEHLYVEIDATDAQKAKIGPLVQQAASDLLPLHEQLQAAHVQAVQGLTPPTVDRAALETAREAHLQLADQASKRIVQLLGDVGDALTPAQRNALAARLRAILRRRSRPVAPGEKPLTFGRLELDTAAHRVRLDGVECELTGYQFDLLVTLAKNAGRVLSRDALLDAVKGEQLESFDRSIDVHVSTVAHPERLSWLSRHAISDE